jgi:hypothetical protein
MGIGTCDVASGEHKIAEFGQAFFEPIHPGFEFVGTFRIHGGQFASPHGVRGREVASQGEQFTLDAENRGSER